VIVPGGRMSIGRPRTSVRLGRQLNPAAGKYVIKVSENPATNGDCDE